MSAASSIEKYWYSNHWSKWLLWPLSACLFLLTVLKRQLYQLGIKPSKRMSVPVIIVGNITVGGTGKTPAIAYLSRLLTNNNYKVGIVSRGYRAQAAHFPFWVTDSDTAETVGDEVYMLKKQLELPIVIGPDRSKAVELLIKKSAPDIILSDDGLQHYKMARDFELLLVDGERGFGNQLCLPFGPLRETIGRLNSVDYIIQNGGEQALFQLEQFQDKFSHIKLEVSGLIHLKTGESVSLANIKNKSVNAVCGIGNPQRFFNTLNPLCQQLKRYSFQDHHTFKMQDFAEMNDDIIIMTEKDAGKCQSFAKDNWYYLTVRMKLDDLQASKLLASIKRKIRRQ
ncbi:tetraacyldisaccharide 4'-kinase [Aliikangiella marina]|uniref:Tetraacyldisaccharide 4'-kinase n=1 Tax=Aliikangiella marina TaxID=1712262 RepID=A0A545TJB5_9GAMM|nr:tetraacyldisaccharide 4'-kinase [Aliikangiella marina]TQV77303.1 tetraacyldisaccharide 4'-kinase [Aliikangiella marina]